GLNYKDGRDVAQQWLKQRGDPYTTSAFDEDGRAGIDWGVYGVPETFVIDKRGNIRYKHTGPVDQKAVTDKIMPLVRELEKEPA
ncbi:MAG: redoxin family protein, partial [Halobacteria archaeon]|nr:redoxin family protein [Halobacteria archaeon]